MNLPAWLAQWDRETFIRIHSEYASTLVDPFMKLLREPGTWVPLYIWIIYVAFKRFRPFAWMFLLLSIVCFAVADFSSASILKPYFMRPRPCHEESLQAIIRPLVSCGGHYSFPSSHATNHFALASFWFFALAHLQHRKWYILWLWAFVIIYAQIYVGKHYPLDVIAGGLWGLCIGLSAFVFFRWWIALQKNKKTFPHV
jgi:undecaprenyl-diphosphatase